MGKTLLPQQARKYTTGEMMAGSSLQASRWTRLIGLISLTVLLAACSPQYNWRETQGPTLPFSILMPARPTSFTRQIDLDGTLVDMTMTATEVNQVTFAVGVAELSSVNQTTSALASMRIALLNNIAGSPQNTPLPAGKNLPNDTLDIVANGIAGGHPVYLMARLQSSNRRIYQILILGPRTAITIENADMFFGSFVPG
jgi:hypothetical protein